MTELRDPGTHPRVHRGAATAVSRASGVVSSCAAPPATVSPSTVPPSTVSPRTKPARTTACRASALPIGVAVGLASSAGLLLAALASPPASAKIPGQVHCYGGVCHRVLSVAEVERLVGRAFETQTSYYDTPERDRFNAGVITSSGERFDADSGQRVASSVYPDGTELLIWNPRNGRAAHVRVNDFGPFYASRTLDVTRRIAEDLGFEKSGVAQLKVVVVAAPSPEEARHRKGRSYSHAYGFIGKFGADDVDDLASDLIADAADHRRETERALLASAGKNAASAVVSGAPEGKPARSEARDDGVRDVAESGDPARPSIPPQSAGVARTRLPWVHRVALARAENSLSATTALLVALAEHAAMRAPDSTPDASAESSHGTTSPAVMPDSGAAVATAGDVRAPAGRSVVARSAVKLAAAPRPDVILHDIGIPRDSGQARGDAPAAVAVAAPGLVASPPVPAPLQATAVVALHDDAEPGALAVVLREAGLGGADAWPRWMLMSLLAASLMLVALLRRERQPSPAAGSAHPVAATAPQRRLSVAPARHAAAPGVTADQHARAARAEATTIAPEAIPARTAHAPLDDLLRHARDLAADGCPDAALPVLRLVVAGTEQACGPDATALVAPLAALGEALRDSGRAAEALTVYQRALQISAPLEATTPRVVADLLEARALLLVQFGTPVAAAADAARAVALRDVPGAETVDPDLGVALSILGEAQRRSGDPAAAEAAHRRALDCFIAREGRSGLRAAGSMTSLAEVLVETGRTAEARALLLVALPILEQHLGLRHPGVAQSRAALANVHQAHGDIDAAVRLRRQSLAILESVEGHDHPDVVSARRHLAALIG